MEESYIKDYEINLLENVFDNDIERLKAIKYGLEYILENIEHNIDTDNDKYKYNQLTTCLITINKIVEEEDYNNTIPQF